MAADLRLVDPKESVRHADPALDDALSTMAQEGRVPRSPLLRGHGVSVITQAVRTEKRRRMSRLIGAGTLVAAAASASLWLLPGQESSPVADAPALASLVAGGTAIEIKNADGVWSLARGGELLPTGGSVRTGASGSAEMKTAGGIWVKIHERSELELSRSDARGSRLAQVNLRVGTVEVEVPQLGPSSSFSVRAGKSDVIVHGTKFRVTVAEEGAAACVVVHDGRAEVREGGSTVWLNAGGSTGCALPDPVPASKAREVEAIERPTEQATSDASLRPTTVKRATESSSLKEQNALFQRALEAERQGRTEEARALLGQFLSKYPHSPLEGQVRAQRKALSTRPAPKAP